MLGHFESLGSYDLVDLPTALERLKSGGGFGGGPQPMTATDSGAASTQSNVATGAPQSSGGSSGGSSAGSSGSGGPTATPACDPAGKCSVPPSPPDSPVVTIEPPGGPPVPLEPQIMELSSARLVLVSGYNMCTGGPEFLVPSYLFGPNDVGPVTAVTDADLQGPSTGAQTKTDVAPCPGQDLPPQPKPAPYPPFCAGNCAVSAQLPAQNGGASGPVA
jgi:hypothetical protein